MTEHDVIIASHAAGEPVGDLPPEAVAESAQLRNLCEALRRAAPATSAQRREALIELAPGKQLSWGWYAAAAGLVIALSVVAFVFAISDEQQFVTPPSGAAHAPNTPDSNEEMPRNIEPPTNEEEPPSPKPDWLEAEIKQVFSNKPGGFSGSDPPGERMGGGPGSSEPEVLLLPVLAQAGFTPLYWPDAPTGFELQGGAVRRKAATGIEFDLVQIEYGWGDSHLTLFQAVETEASALKLAAPKHKNGAAIRLRRDGLVLLLLSNDCDEGQLAELAKTLRKAPK